MAERLATMESELEKMRTDSEQCRQSLQKQLREQEREHSYTMEQAQKKWKKSKDTELETYKAKCIKLENQIEELQG
jgi:hypothetical protein